MEQKSGVKKRKKEKSAYFDYSLLFIIVFLLCFGLIMLFSASSYESQVKFGDPIYYFRKQVISTLVGLALMIFVTLVDYHFWERFVLLGYLLSILLLALVKTPLGITANGATRWIGFGSLSFQPSEFAKVVIIVVLASIISKSGKKLLKWRGMIKIFLIICPVLVLVIKLTSNLSTGIIIAGIGFVMIFVASPQYGKFIAMGAGIFSVAGAVVYAIASGILPSEVSYRFERIEAWLNPEAYAQEGGFQTLQALYAIGSGGIFGKGLGKSIQKLDFLPEAQNDMIFSIICEELGLFGAVSLILLFLLLIWRFMIIANNAPDLFGALIVVGVMGHIAIQVILNIAVVTNSIPNTGITLPFISYGGTSVAFLLAEMGLVLSVSRHIKLQEY